jgi:CRISPR-associated protein Csb2
VAHDSPSARYAFDIRDRADQAAFSVWPIALASKLVELVRDATVVKLVKALPLQQAKIERALIGRKPDGTNEGPPSARVRIIPLPSIGHHHADHNIRRILVEVPSSCPLRHDDVHWALSGLDIIDQETGEVYDGILTPGADETMQHHYGIGESTGSHIWRSQTPVALPDAAKRRRIEPTRKDSEAKDGHERIVEQSRAAAALVQALRQAGIRGNANAIRVQREPFDARGQRVESFAAGTRFCKERLWHVEIRFEAPIAGPMTVGDGRFLGLGVMAPVRELGEVHAFSIKSGLNDEAEPVEITGALRRAVMARVQQQLGARNLLPAFFTGHDIDGTPARREQHEHLTFTFDPAVKRLLVIAPHMLARRQPTRDETSNLDTLKRALVDFTELRAGSAGRLALRSCTIDVNDDPLFEPARTWETLTAYQVTRHRKDKGATAAFVEDVLSECQRCGLPEPQVTPHETRGVRGVGLTGRARLTFAVAVAGPIVLGRSRHFGGGLFIAASI